MKKIFFILFLCLGCHLGSWGAESTDSCFMCKVQNKEYNIYLQIDLYHKNIKLSGADYLGEMCGFLGDNQDFRKWFITDAEVLSTNHARLEMVNDTGSEDLEADLTYNPETQEYTLKQGSGSTLKIARNRKWKKLASTLIFK